MYRCVIVHQLFLTLIGGADSLKKIGWNILNFPNSLVPPAILGLKTFIELDVRWDHLKNEPQKIYDDLIEKDIREICQ